MVSHTCNCSTQKVEAGGSPQIQNRPRVHSEFKTNMNYIARPCPKMKYIPKYIGCYIILFLLDFLMFVTFSKFAPCNFLSFKNIHVFNFVSLSLRNKDFKSQKTGLSLGLPFPHVPHH